MAVAVVSFDTDIGFGDFSVPVLYNIDLGYIALISCLPLAVGIQIRVTCPPLLTITKGCFPL